MLKRFLAFFLVVTGISISAVASDCSSRFARGELRETKQGRTFSSPDLMQSPYHIPENDLVLTEKRGIIRGKTAFTLFLELTKLYHNSPRQKCIFEGPFGLTILARGIGCSFRKTSQDPFACGLSITPDPHDPQTFQTQGPIHIFLQRHRAGVSNAGKVIQELNSYFVNEPEVMDLLNELFQEEPNLITPIDLGGLQ